MEHTCYQKPGVGEQLTTQAKKTFVSMLHRAFSTHGIPLEVNAGGVVGGEGRAAANSEVSSETFSDFCGQVMWPVGAPTYASVKTALETAKALLSISIYAGVAPELARRRSALVLQRYDPYVAAAVVLAGSEWEKVFRAKDALPASFLNLSTVSAPERRDLQKMVDGIFPY